ncbi:MAG TPA: flagellar filament capping protein FliD [Sphingobacteriaceae bacterium]|nr:flagellar filament capping protein FliD [Sphingobacteriaceae bacterium]
MRVGGLMSGVDWNDIVEQLIYLEAKPLRMTEERKDLTQQRLRAWQGLRSDLQTLHNAVRDLLNLNTAAGVKAASGNETVFTAAAGMGAQPGSYTIVVEQLAQAHSVRSNQFDNQPLGFAGAFQLDGSGTGQWVEIQVAADDTLANIRAKINAAGAGVSATIVDGHLVLTRAETGAGQIAFTDTDGVLAGLGLVTGGAWAHEMTAGQDARITVNGLAITRSSNTIDDAIEGITLNLLQAGPDAVTLTVAKDEDSILDKINSFVKAYNSVLAKMQGLYDHETGGVLNGDSTLSRMIQTLRRLPLEAATGLTGDFTHLFQVGIGTVDRSGALQVDEQRLRDALANDPQGVFQLFAADTVGVATRLDEALKQMAGTTGTAANRIKFLEQNIRDFDRHIEILNERLERREQALLAQFRAMEQVMAQLQSQSAFLGQFIFQNMMGQG